MTTAQDIIKSHTTQDPSSIYWALAARLSPFVVGLLFSVVGLAVVGAAAPALVLVFRRQDPFVSHHVISELSNQAVFWGAIGVGTIVGAMTCGLGYLVVVPALLLLFVVGLPFWIISLNEAYHGRTYQYPWLTSLLSRT